MPPPAFLWPLNALDPAMARSLAAGACDLAEAPGQAMVDTILWALDKEIHFGQAVAAGFGRLLAGGGQPFLEAYRAAVRQAGTQGAGLGRLVAQHLVPVLLAGDPELTKAFHRSLDVLMAKGLYLVREPLRALDQLLVDGGDRKGARHFLELLQTVFKRHLSYHQLLNLGHQIPRAVLAMPAADRTSRMTQLARLGQADVRLLDPFLEGLGRGLDRLEAAGLELFVEQALAEARGDLRAGIRFLALVASRARGLCHELQSSVSLEDIRPALAAYLRARCGRDIPLRPLADWSSEACYSYPPGASVATDGRSLFLPAEIRVFPSREANRRLVEAMARFESAVIEYNTFAFDLERALELPACRLRAAAATAQAAPHDPQAPPLTDLERFWAFFEHPDLAAAVFTVVEHGRLRRRLAHRYPGLVRRHLPILREPPPQRSDSGVLDALYRSLALGLSPEAAGKGDARLQAVCRDARDFFVVLMDAADTPVEASAEATCRIYALLENSPATGTAAWSPPWRRRLHPEAFRATFSEALRQAEALYRHLRARGLEVLRGDLLQQLIRGDGPLSPQVLQGMTGRVDGGAGDTLAELDRVDPETARLLRQAASQAPEDEGDVIRVHWFREWDRGSGDYLHRHVRVRDRQLPETTGDHYARVLQRHAALVQRVRKAFELLKPQELQILRRWVEGDDLDYRALLDFALDRKMGRWPSERLYIKRLKQHRDVSVLLLVDVSRSTANIVNGTGSSVLEVAKEALVLFSQALERLGDRYAIAAYSGTGRLGVDYFRVKDFDEPLGDAARRRIGALQPQRSTRMGAAVRRATQELRQADSRVRLLILLGDGFPNDLDYKQAYAIDDTRRALWEAQAYSIATHAITVNLPGNTQLDELYGHVHHNVISDVSELPDKLLRIYGALTRA
jgi:nitric oxide reductase NorD protein